MSTFVPIDSIVIPPTRQRREFDPEKLALLMESIGSKGLMHPIVVRVDENGEMQLVAGERRLRAIKDLWGLGGKLRYDSYTLAEGTIPVVTLSELNALEAEEAELEENTIRVDLTWQERADAERRLFDLRKKQDASFTPSDLAAEVSGTREGSKMDQTKKRLILAEHLNKPEIANAKSADEAYKILKKEEESARNRRLAETVGATFSSSQHLVLNQSCLVGLKETAESIYDVILTDPPYGIGADEFGDAGGALAQHDHTYSDDHEHFTSLMDTFGPESFRVAKPQAHLYLFCDIDRFAELRSWFGACGWRVHRTPLIWHKPKAHRVPWPEMGPRRQYECILYAVKGNKHVNFIGSDVLTCELDENLGHAAQKPVALYRSLLERSCVPGNRVLDAFAGTGPIFPAAHSLKLYATGYEVDPGAYALAYKRIRGLE